ncbi:restriction endonuclease HpaI [Achromatium sp. WMS3]|nr:restriction endonuclease HpaI [Achromatium sp. WMS3]
MTYESLDLKKPIESDDYQECSEFVVSSIETIMKEAMDTGQNKIIINTNLKFGIPMENVNKIAGPFIEAWVFEVFTELLEDSQNKYNLINVEAGERLNMADVILQFKKIRKRSSAVTGYVDVKATSKDIEGSGKSPNITSFARIRSAYVKDPDYIFVILSIRHRVFSTRDEDTKMMMGVMEVIDFNAYDLKYLSDTDLSYNPALGTGQIQVKDIHYVTIIKRTTWEFCQLLDKKFIASKKGYRLWLEYAEQNGWIK